MEIKENDLCVLFSEEFGFQSFLWHPKMNKKSLIAWWEDLESVEDFTTDSEDTTAKHFPGQLIKMDSEGQEDLWHKLLEEKAYPYCHFFNNGDAFLKIDGQVYRHKGYDPHYYDPKPTDVMTTFEAGKIVCEHTRQETLTCSVCQERNKNEKTTIGLVRIIDKS